MKLKSKINSKPLRTQIEVSDLSYTYSSQTILQNVSFSINKGDFVAIMGPNGAGKSTLIKILVGLLEIKNFKKHISINGKIAYIPQKFNQDAQFPTTVKELLALECCKCEHRNKVVSSLRLSKLEDKQFKDLSGGQQQRVFVALALLSNPDILILDEPTVGIDSNTQEEFYKLLHELNTKKKLTILLVTHDTSMISNYVTRTLCVGNKTLIEDTQDSQSSHLHRVYPESFHKMHHHHH